MRIYISGPISGRPIEEAERHFNHVAQFLKDGGHTVINPIEIAHWKLAWASYMRIAFDVIDPGNIDAILMLKGWEESRGACLERYMAELNQIPVWYQYGEDGKKKGGE